MHYYYATLKVIKMLLRINAYYNLLLIDLLLRGNFVKNKINDNIKQNILKNTNIILLPSLFSTT